MYNMYDDALKKAFLIMFPLSVFTSEFILVDDDTSYYATIKWYEYKQIPHIKCWAQYKTLNNKIYHKLLNVKNNKHFDNNLFFITVLFKRKNKKKQVYLNLTISRSCIYFLS